MSKKFGLGKGLNALITEDTSLGPSVSKNKKESSEKNLIDINLIKCNSEQPRKTFDYEKIMELSESIKHHGVVQPIILRKEEDNYVIVEDDDKIEYVSKIISELLKDIDMEK